MARHHHAGRRRPQREGQQRAAHQVAAGADPHRKVDHLRGENERAHHAQQRDFGVVKPALRAPHDVAHGREPRPRPAWPTPAWKEIRPVYARSPPQ